MKIDQHADQKHFASWPYVCMYLVTDFGTNFQTWGMPSLVPWPLPDFILQPWRKIGRRPGIITMSRTGNGGLG